MAKGPDYPKSYRARHYQAERAAVDQAQAYAESIMSEGGPSRVRNYLTKEEAAAPVYAAVNNDMRSRVEMWELRRDKPESIFAYWRGFNQERGHKLRPGHRIEVTNWMGVRLGYATVSSTWRSNFGDERAAFRLDFDGTQYSGTLYGDSGTYCRLRKLKGSK